MTTTEEEEDEMTTTEEEEDEMTTTEEEEDEMTTTEEEEDEVGEAIKEKSALRSGATRARPDPTTPPTVGTPRRTTTTSDRKNTCLPATTAPKKDTLGLTVLPEKRRPLYGIIELPKSTKGMEKEEMDPLQTLLATNNDSQGPPPSARR